ncbi:nitroreductase family deazaflavin-dependent oxidoreductase [Candidatus Poriferisodalis sp.]|uniref:nitroreductase family deazaflavin-dependent oxidoreductase n=1 Tax=Candidatus Poriferisodalis sp. TaxID=3101277 RepID=UPI003B02146E
MDFLKVNEPIIKEFRENGGQCSGWLKGAPMILVTMTGAKTGRELCSPLVYSIDGDDIVIIASKGGAPTNPNWYHNLVANPTVTVEVGTDTWEATAVLTEGDERKRLFDAQAALMPQFADYEKSATGHGREIPVFRLVRN